MSEFISRQGGNIINADQHSSNPEGGDFFIRLEFCHESSLAEMQEQFKPLAEKLSARFSFVDKNKPLRMGILASKEGHCLNDVLYHYQSGQFHVKIPFVISNHKNLEDLVSRYGIPFYHIPASSQDRREGEILKIVKEESDFLVLARYMQILSPKFIEAYGRDIINIHHSFLPSFKGAAPYKQAFDRGVKVIGATAHFVTDDLDEGPIIEQVVSKVSHRDSVESLMRKGQNLEKQALAQAVHDYTEYRIIRYHHKTIVFS